jgi:threonyl-tRNA synthetase
MSQVTVTLPDGSTKQVESGVPVKGGRRGDLSTPCRRGHRRDVNGKLVDLTYPLTEDAKVRIVTTRIPKRSRSTAIRRRTCSPPR